MYNYPITTVKPIMLTSIQHHRIEPQLTTLFVLTLLLLIQPALAVDSFKPIQGPNHPLKPAVQVGSLNGHSVPTLVDIDNDQDFDAFIGADDGEIYYYENTGTVSNPIFEAKTGPSNPLDQVGLSYSAPTFADIDQDGDSDVFIGTRGSIAYYKNTGTTSKPIFEEQTGIANPFSWILKCDDCLFKPTLVDIDSDNDFDAFIGKNDGTLDYYENIGSANQPTFEARTGTTNPFDRIILSDNIPTFVDIDNDGDFDAFLGEDEGYIHYYQNTGTATQPTFVERTGTDNPLNQVKKFNTAPTFIDIDNDNDVDAFIGDNYGFISYYQNTGNATTPNLIEKTDQTNPFGWVDVGSFSTLAWGDIDNDGDLDVVIGEHLGSLKYYQNLGSPSQPDFIERVGSANPLNDVKHYNGYLAPALVDIDSDGDLDMFVGGEELGIYNQELDDGTIDIFPVLYYENTGTAARPNFVDKTRTANPFSEVEPVRYSTPAFVDIDNDGDLDAFFGQHQGFLHYYENTGTATRPQFVETIGMDNPFVDIKVGWGTFSRSAPTFVDIDGDNDFDAFIGQASGTLWYYENIGTASQPNFVNQTGVANPFVEVSVGENSSPSLVDIDNDGYLDALIGNRKGIIYYYKNNRSSNSSNFIERTGVANPLNGIDIGDNSAPFLADLDNDNDLDAFIGALDGSVWYYPNTGNASQPNFGNVPFQLEREPNNSALSVIDINNDGDLDAIVGQRWGDLSYYENVGTAALPNFIERTESASPFHRIEVDSNNAVPSLADIDNDGDLDAIIGSEAGNLKYYENTGTANSPNFVERTDTVNPFHLIKVEENSFPSWADIDQDNDLDLFIGNSSGTVTYYENIGNAKTPKFVEQTGTANFLGAVNLSNSAPTLVDIDNDGDLDAFIGVQDGRVKYYENIGTTGALPRGDSYNRVLEVRLRCLDCEHIYYTADGTEPTRLSTPYQAPITLTQNTTLKYLTVDALGTLSEVQTESYIIDTQPPNTTIISPENQAVVKTISSIQGTVSDPAAGSGVDRIELQLTEGTFYLTDDQNNPFTTTPAWLRVAINQDNWFYQLPDSVPFPQNTRYTIKVRAYDQVGNVAVEQTTFVKVDQAPAQLFLKLNSATLLNNETLKASGTLVSRRFFPVDEKLAGLPIKLLITAPDGSTRTQLTHVQSDIGQYEINDLAGFSLEGTYTLQAHFEGNDLLTAADSKPQTVLVGESAGYAIIIQGRIANGEGLESHNKTTNRIYEILIDRGFEAANIYYYNDNPNQAGIDGQPTVADFVSLPELQNRINGSPAPFYLIMIDHGDRDGNFYINDVDLDYVTPEIWAWWLDALEAGLTSLDKPRIIMIGHCFSGKSLEILSKPGRLIISSAAANEESFKGPREPDGIRGGEYFMDELFNALGRGDSFRDAFNQTAEKTNQYTDRGGNRFINIVNDFGDESVQHPLIDINGDGQGSHELKLEQNAPTNPETPSPRFNLAEMYLGAGADYDTNYAGNPADILSVADPLYLSPEQMAANLSMTVNEVRRVKEAAVNVRLPSTELAPADTSRSGYAEQREIAELIEINLLCDFSQRCDRNTDDVTDNLFTEPGKYNLYYFVVDNETDNRSPVHHSVVYKTKANNGAPSRFELQVPENQATTKTAITFDWQTSTDPEKEPVTYTLVIAEDEDFHNVAYQQSDLRDTELAIEPSTLQPGTRYYWTVEAVDFFGARTTASERRVFRIESEE